MCGLKLTNINIFRFLLFRKIIYAYILTCSEVTMHNVIIVISHGGRLELIQTRPLL